MPWSPAAHRFFALCAGPSRKRARKKCPPKAAAERMMREGIKRPKKR